jgi:hypothetical protein
MNSEKIERIVDLAATLAARAEEIDQVLVIYRVKRDGEDERQGSYDNDLELRDALWLVECFKAWMLGGVGKVQ